ncbi:MAG TPA: hypothetical protein VFU73_12450 [Actinocrinis sp.]|nr:hypothetical protein [Actinocrinis sp.]
MSNSDAPAGPPADRRRPGEVRLTDTGEAEIFDGARWRPLASLAEDPDTGDRRAEGAQVPRRRSAESDAHDSPPSAAEGAAEAYTDTDGTVSPS